ncbi:MAG: hypothetical protein FWB91_02425 [Defluviitaleaceae bacterium]|nr:hypothetical protein [Defluviitaleaceae bacterium]
MRGLKGAAINHMHLMNTRNFGLYLLITAFIFAIYLIVGEPVFLATTQILFLGTLPLGVLEASEVSFASKWTSFERAFAISQVSQVLARYVIFIIVSLILAALWFVSPFHAVYEEQVAMMGIGFMLLWAQLTCIVYFPIMYLLNPNKKSTSTVILLSAAGGAIALNLFVIAPLAEDSPWITIAIVVGLYVISVALSIIFNNFHRGRAA